MNDFSILGQLERNLQTKKVGIVEFAESTGFCNKPLYPKQKLLLKLMFLEELTDQEEHWLDEWLKSDEVNLSPDIRERVKWCKENDYPHFREVVLVGGRRSSKGFVTGLALAKKMYDTLQLQDPNAHYGIDANKEIYFTCVAASEKQAKELQYADFAGTVNSCAAMEPYIAKMQELEFSVRTDADERRLAEFKRQTRRVQKDISKLRGRALASNSRTVRGYTSMAIVFDEMAFFQQGESDSADEAVYEAAVPSLAQFAQDAMIFCNSSPYSKVGKFYERWEEAMSRNKGSLPDSPMMMGAQFPSWGLFEDWWDDPTYRGKKKTVTASPDWDLDLKTDKGDYFYTKEDRIEIRTERHLESDNVDKFKVERRAQWAEVIDAYLDPTLVDRMYEGIPSDDARHFTPISSNWSDSTYLNRYKAHLDPSSTTAGFGFALGHTREVTVKGVTNEHVVFDIIKRWQPTEFPDNVIDWQIVMREIINYIDIFRPYEITMDQFQSAAPIQELRRELARRNIETQVYEKTATSAVNWNRAETFKTALYQGLVHAPYDTTDSQFSAEELKYLQQISTGRLPRVEKQDIGPVTTKDMADCVMEVTESLIGNVIAAQARQDLELPARYGGAGGYPIGGPDRGGMGDVSGGPFADLYSRRIGEQRGPGSSFSGGGAAARRGGASRGGRNPARGRW